MNLIIILILSVALSTELKDLQTKTFFITEELSDVKTVIQGQDYRIRNFENAEYAINIELKGNNSYSWDICYAKQGSVQFGDYEKFHRVIYNATHNPDEEHAADPSYFLSTPIMVNMVHTKQGLGIVTSDHSLLIYSVVQTRFSQTGFQANQTLNIDFDNLRSQAASHEVPQIIYAPLIEYIYIIYRDQVIGGKISDNMTLRNISIPGLENNDNFVGQIKVFDKYIFVPVGKEGLDIYSINEKGEISEYQSFTSQDLYSKLIPINIVDIQFSVGNQTYAYLLDEHNGVTRFTIKLTLQKLIFNRDDNLGLIAIVGGFAINVFQQEYLLVLKSVGVNQQLIEIGLHGDEWFQVKRHYLTGQYFDIDITNEFVLLRGKDEHRIIRTGVYEEFEPEFKFYTGDDYFTENANSYYEEYVFIPKLQSVEFYNDQFGVGNDPQMWSFNQTYPFLFGLTTHTLVELPYIISAPYIFCSPKSEQNVGRIYNYEIDMNSTSCEQKDKYLEENPNFPPQLAQCNYKDKFSLTVVYAQATIYNTQELLGVIIGLVVLLILLALLIVFLYRRFKTKEEGLTSKVTGFDNNRGYDLEPNEGPSTQGL